jgi:hypothetical protein
MMGYMLKTKEASIAGRSSHLWREILGWATMTSKEYLRNTKAKSTLNQTTTAQT